MGNGVSLDSGTKMATAVVLIHSVIRRNLKASVQTIDEFQKEETRKDLTHFLEYLRFIHEFIVSHHHHEDTIIFPATKAKIQDLEETIEKLEKDHKELHEHLELYEKNLKKAAKKEDPKELEDLKVCLEKIIELLFPHLQIEEDKLTAEVYNKNFTQKELENIESQIQKAARKEKESKVFFALILYNLDENERSAFIRNNGIPKFVTKFLLPVAWKKHYVNYIPFFQYYPRK